MYHHAGRLIHNQQIVVFVDDIEGDLLRHNVATRRRRNDHVKPVTGNAAIGRFLNRAVYRDLPRGDKRSRLGPGYTAVPGHEEIEPITSVPHVLSQRSTSTYRLTIFANSHQSAAVMFACVYAATKPQITKSALHRSIAMMLLVTRNASTLVAAAASASARTG